MSTVLRTFIGSHSTEHHILEARDGTPYCDCPGWKFSKSSPKTCKHLERYLATTSRYAGSHPSSLPAAVSSPAAPASRGQRSIGKDSNGASVYAGDWLRDTVTGFVLCAAQLRSAQVDQDFMSWDGQWVIPARKSVVFIPSFGEAIPHERVAGCDREAYRAARMGASAPRHIPPVSLDGPSVFEKLDWL